VKYGFWPSHCFTRIKGHWPHGSALRAGRAATTSLCLTEIELREVVRVPALRGTHHRLVTPFVSAVSVLTEDLSLSGECRKESMLRAGEREARP